MMNKLVLDLTSEQVELIKQFQEMLKAGQQGDEVAREIALLMAVKIILVDKQ